MPHLRCGPISPVSRALQPVHVELGIVFKQLVSGYSSAGSPAQQPVRLSLTGSVRLTEPGAAVAAESLIYLTHRLDILALRMVLTAV